MQNVSLMSKRTVVFTPQVAGSSTLTSSLIDMQEFDTVLFDILIGSLTTGQTKGTVTVNAGNLSNGSDQAPLAPNPILTIGDTDNTKLEAIELVKPAGFRYLQLVITRNSQAAAISSVVATLYFAHRKPTSDDAATVAQTFCVVDPEYVNSQLSTVTATYGNSTTQVVTTYRNAS